MGMIEKGVVLTLEGDLDRNGNYTKAKVQATSAIGAPTLPLTIPWYLRGSMGMLEKGTEIAYAIFDDASGIILSRIDGNWEGKIEEKGLSFDTLGQAMHVEGNIKVSERLESNEVVCHDVALSSHRHKNRDDGSEYTDVPVGGTT